MFLNDNPDWIDEEFDLSTQNHGKGWWSSTTTSTTTPNTAFDDEDSYGDDNNGESSSSSNDGESASKATERILKALKKLSSNELRDISEAVLRELHARAIVNEEETRSRKSKAEL